MAEESILEQKAVRGAIKLLREYGVTPDQYATWDIEGQWSVAGFGEFPDRETAFAAARSKVRATGEWAEVWRQWGDGAAAESWVVKPGDVE